MKGNEWISIVVLKTHAYTTFPYIKLKRFSHTEHTADMVGHPYKPFIQPKQPWSDPSYTRAIRVCPCKPCMVVITSKTDVMSVYDRTRQWYNVWDRTFNRTWSPFHIIIIPLFILVWWLQIIFCLCQLYKNVHALKKYNIVSCKKNTKVLLILF